MTLEPLRAAPDRGQHDVILGPATVRSRRSSLERTALRATNNSNPEKAMPPRPRLRRDARRIKRSKGSLWRRVMGLSEANSAEIPRCVEISGPTNFRHNFHATFDTTSVTFAGLPSRWNQQTTLINRQFGISLRSAPRVEVEGYAARIPAVLVLLRRELIDNGGLRHEGVFRVSANKSTQLHYKTQLDAGQFRGCVSSTDATCMAALIKEWFRALPEPLLQCLPRDLIVAVAARTDNDEQASEELLQRLPEPNQSVFLWLLDLLADTAQYENINRMSIKALAIVLAPNLYTVSPTASPMEVVALMDAAVKAVQLCLRVRAQTPRPTLAPQHQHTLLT